MSYKINLRDENYCPYYGDRRGIYCFYFGKYNPGCDGLMWLQEDNKTYYCGNDKGFNETMIGTPEDIKIINLIKSICKRKELGKALSKIKDGYDDK